MRRRLILGVGAFVGVALVLGITHRAARKPSPASPAVVKPVVAEAPPALPEPPTRPVAVAPAPPERAGRAAMAPLFDGRLEGDAPESLTPPVVHVEVGDASARGPAPGPEALVPPVVDVGKIEFGRGARPTAEPLVPPVIVVTVEEMERPVPRR